jgi:hypothetical protein
VLQAVVSVAIWNYFRKNGGGSLFQTTIAPWVSFFVQVYLVYLLVSNLSTFAGTSGFAQAIPVLSLAVILFGLVWGFVLKRLNPAGYANIGHMVNDEA